MIERLARGADDAEDRSFDAIRSRFIQEVAEHMDTGHGIAGAERQPDHLFATLMEITVLAARAGEPSPFPWFTAFCARMLAEAEGRSEPPGEPTLN